MDFRKKKNKDKDKDNDKHEDGQTEQNNGTDGVEGKDPVSLEDLRDLFQ